MKLKLDRKTTVEYYQVYELYRRNFDGSWEMKAHFGWSPVEGEGEVEELEELRKEAEEGG